MTDKQLENLAIRLFESKCKQYSQQTLTVWVDLMKTLDQSVIEQAMIKMALDGDDFPSIGKLMKIIDKIYQTKAKELFLHIMLDDKKLITCPTKIQDFFSKRYNIKKLRTKALYPDNILEEFTKLCLTLKQDALENKKMELLK